MQKEKSLFSIGNSSPTSLIVSREGKGTATAQSCENRNIVPRANHSYSPLFKTITMPRSLLRTKFSTENTFSISLFFVHWGIGTATAQSWPDPMALGQADHSCTPTTHRRPRRNTKTLFSAGKAASTSNSPPNPGALSRDTPR